MNLLSQIKDNALTIAVIIMILAIGSSVYTYFFSNEAKLIRELKKMIAEKEQIIAELESRYAELKIEEQKRLEEINALKDKLKDIQDKINHGEVSIDEIKNGLLDIDSALDIIEDYTRGVIADTSAVDQ
jgi:peptidoglycan hydrolase CwlO-like protein